VAPGVVDANRCLSWVLQKPGPIPVEYRAVIGDRIYGCDDCQDACPISVRLGRRATIPPVGVTAAWVDALALLDATDDEIERRYRHWYIADRDVRWIRRNALVVVGNVADPADARARHTLERYRADIDPILADHADWATDRLDTRAREQAAT
jgi:epoxyqueuosine reductase